MEFELQRLQNWNLKLQKNIFFKVLNMCYNFMYSSWFYCSCRKFYGCPLENGERSNCLICQIRTGYDIQEIEKI